jgi:hypothetical protein
MPNNIPETYASPGLRWGLFLHDHPHAPDPVFRMARFDDPEVNVPEEFATGGQEKFTGDFVVCTIDPADGGQKITAWREIPSREKRGGAWHDLARTPDNWRKLTTMALGRALKQAGYADDTSDLKALLLWRRRDVEMRMLEAGITPPPALGQGPADEDLDAAARAQPHAEHPDSAAVAREVEPDADIVVEPDEQWSADAAGLLRPLVERLTGPQRAELQGWAEGRKYGPIQQLSAGGPMRAVIARCRAMIPKDASDAPPPTETAAPGPPSAPTAQPDADPKGAAVDPNAKAPMPMVRSLWDAIQKLAGPDGDQEKAEVAFAAAEFLASDGWDEDGLTFAEVAQGWSALHSVGVYG